MFWPILGAASIAAGLLQLGALSVQVVVLKAMLAVILAAALLLGLLLTWRWYKDSRNAHLS